MLVRNCVKKDWPENTRSLPPCMPNALSGPREEFESSTVKAEGMNDARNRKWEEKSTAKSEQTSTLLHCTLLSRLGYWANFTAPVRLTLGLKSQSLLYIPLVMTWPPALATARLSLHRALLTHGPASVFKESEKQLLLLPALRHCQTAASFAVHLHCSNSGRNSGSSGVWTSQTCQIS